MERKLKKSFIGARRKGKCNLSRNEKEKQQVMIRDL